MNLCYIRLRLQGKSKKHTWHMTPLEGSEATKECIFGVNIYVVTPASKDSEQWLLGAGQSRRVDESYHQCFKSQVGW